MDMNSAGFDLHLCKKNKTKQANTTQFLKEKNLKKIKGTIEKFFHSKRNQIRIKQIFGSKIELINCSTVETHVKSNLTMRFNSNPFILHFPTVIYNNTKEKPRTVL